MLNWIALAASTVRISMPYASGALGGTITERGGVVNIALEGLMLGGAFTFVCASWYVERALGPGGASTAAWLAPLVGLAGAVLTGLLLALIHAIATVTFKADNIISGVALNIFALGATNFLLVRIFASSSNSERCLTFHNADVFSHSSRFESMNQLFHPLILVTVAMFVAAHVMLYRTRFGLRLRSVGENPAAADSLGVNVPRYRYGGVLLGGMVASLGGVWLASDQGLFSSNMTGGRGYIALAAMIVGKWRPWGAAAACLIFGFADAMQNQLQSLQGAAPEAMHWLAAIAASVPRQFIQVLPHILTLIVLAGFIGRSTAPAALGVPFEKEEQ